MKEKNLLKIKEVEVAIEKSKASGKFDLKKLLSNDENLLDIGERFPIQIYIGTKEDFYEINNYLVNELSKESKEQCENIENLRSVIWHFRQLQELQNAENVENRNLNKYGLHKVPMPQFIKNSKGEIYDYESRVMMKEYFSTFDEEIIGDKEERKKIVYQLIHQLPKKQRVIITEILNHNSQSEICDKYNMSKQAVSNLYNKAIKKIKDLLESQ